MQHNLEFVNHY